MTKLFWFQLLISDNLLVLLVFHGSKLNIFGLWTVGQGHFDDRFHYFLAFY